MTKYKAPPNPQKDRVMRLLARVEQRRSEISLRWGEDRFADLLDRDLCARYIQVCD